MKANLARLPGGPGWAVPGFLFLAALALLPPHAARAFSISAVTLSPGTEVAPGTELRMTIDIVTPSQGTWLYAPTQVSSNAAGLRVDVFPTSGMLTAIGSLRETVSLGAFPVGVHAYEVVIHPNFQVNWGTRTNRGSFTVTEEISPPQVYLSATRPETAEPAPNIRVAPGEFTVTRVGDTNEPLWLFLEFSGTAVHGEDYAPVSQPFLMPAGERRLTVLVVPLDDNAVEGDETVIATLSTNPPINSLPNYTVNPRLNQATVVIHDSDAVTTRLEITAPREGANFEAGAPVQIEAVAIDREGYISRVEFYAGEKEIGVSEIWFIRAPDPGTPIHHALEWHGAPEGAHVLTARATATDGTELRSAPVRITVGEPRNQPPGVALVQPASGTVFPSGNPIEIVAQTRDPDGYVPRMEFFADGRKIGEASVDFIRAPDPGQPQDFTFVWREPAPGAHLLTARATDDRGATALSAPVAIEVGTAERLPIVTVTAPDAWAVEPTSNAAFNPAVFSLRRFGPTNDALTVVYSLRGTAVNGTDYERLPGLATIPAGQRSVSVLIRPLADNLREGKETVVLRVEPPPAANAGTPAAYSVGRPQVAAAVISDLPWLAATGVARCVPLSDGCTHVCFTAENGRNYRLEATADFRNWETLFEGVCQEGAWHFIDTGGDALRHRFYRLAPQPLDGAGE